MENSKKKMLREVSHDRLTPKKRDDLVQSEIFGDFAEISRRSWRDLGEILRIYWIDIGEEIG